MRKRMSIRTRVSPRLVPEVGGASHQSYVMHIGDCVYSAYKIPSDGGVLVFVPSYKILSEMEKSGSVWSHRGFDVIETVLRLCSNPEVGVRGV